MTHHKHSNHKLKLHVDRLLSAPNENINKP